MKDFHQQNYYELLEVAVNATQDEILQAYKKARAAYSGNSPALYTVFSKAEAEQILKLVDEAYSVLSNQFKRKEYNKLHYPHLVQQAVPASQPLPSRLVAKEKPFVAAKQLTADLIPLDGYRNVSLKKPKEEKAPVGTTRFGKYEVNEEFEKQIMTTEIFSGELLSQIRNYKKVSLDQMADATKIAKTYLDALEKSDYQRLPALVFLRGFLSQVAKLLDLDAQKVADSYIKIMHEAAKK